MTERYKQSNSAPGTSEASQNPARSKRRHCQGSRIPEALDYSQTSEHLAKDIDREESEHDSEVTDLDHDDLPAPSKTNFFRKRKKAENRSNMVQHSSALQNDIH